MFNGAPKRSRTPNLLIRSQTLYPIELWALFSWCLGPESNRHGCHHPQDFKSCASTSSATQAHHSLNYLEAPIGFEPMIRELQSLALPLGYRCILDGYFFVLDAVPHQIFIEISETSSYPSRTVTLVSATHISEHIWWT